MPWAQVVQGLAAVGLSPGPQCCNPSWPPILASLAIAGFFVCDLDNVFPSKQPLWKEGLALRGRELAAIVLLCSAGLPAPSPAPLGCPELGRRLGLELVPGVCGFSLPAGWRCPREVSEGQTAGTGRPGFWGRVCPHTPSSFPPSLEPVRTQVEVCSAGTLIPTAGAHQCSWIQSGQESFPESHSCRWEPGRSRLQ